MTDDQAKSQNSHKTLLSLVRCAHQLASQNDLKKLLSAISNLERFEPEKRSLASIIDEDLKTKSKINAANFKYC